MSVRTWLRQALAIVVIGAALAFMFTNRFPIVEARFTTEVTALFPRRHRRSRA